jgi:hypothetical protein
MRYDCETKQIGRLRMMFDSGKPPNKKPHPIGVRVFYFACLADTAGLTRYSIPSRSSR